MSARFSSSNPGAKRRAVCVMVLAGAAVVLATTGLFGPAHSRQPAAASVAWVGNDEPAPTALGDTLRDNGAAAPSTFEINRFYAEAHPALF
jgi:hypothetical protein